MTRALAIETFDFADEAEEPEASCPVCKDCMLSTLSVNPARFVGLSPPQYFIMTGGASSPVVTKSALVRHSIRHPKPLFNLFMQIARLSCATRKLRTMVNCTSLLV